MPDLAGGRCNGVERGGRARRAAPVRSPLSRNPHSPAGSDNAGARWRRSISATDTDRSRSEGDSMQWVRRAGREQQMRPDFAGGGSSEGLYVFGGDPVVSFGTLRFVRVEMMGASRR